MATACTATSARADTNMPEHVEPELVELIMGNIAAVPLLERVSPAGIGWLVAGGLTYTAGVFFYLTDARYKFGHFVWHLFVMAGTTCHFLAVLWYSA